MLAIDEIRRISGIERKPFESRESRIGTRLRMTDVHRPVGQKRDLVKHSAVQPACLRWFPEHRVRNALRGFPIPVGLTPKGTIVVSASLKEFHKISVGDHVLIDCE